MYENLFQPIKIGQVELKNRLIVPPMVVNYCTPDGMVTERFIRYHEARAKGGWGLITVEQSVVCVEGKGHPGQPGLWSDDHIEGLSRLTERVHAAGAKISIQINHAGRAASSYITGSQPVGPSPIKGISSLETPRELSVAEIQEIVRQYGEAARRAKAAGFDMITEHAHAGYLIASFLSSTSNKRTDEYGGTLANRARLALEILKDMRAQVGSEFPILYRFSAEEYVEGGLTIRDTAALARLMEDAGVDMMDVSVANDAPPYTVQPAALPHGFAAELSREIKKVVSVPVAVAGRINDPLVAESILASGDADLISMGRASIADPEFPNKVREGRLDDINYCVACLQGCVKSAASYSPVSCLVNPVTGREEEFTVEPAAQRKKILIAGGGVAGMEAAIVAAQRGHDVHLYEQSDRLGGQWLLAAVPPTKTELNYFTIWQKNQLKKLDVKISYNALVDRNLVLQEQPDTVIIATGAKPIVPRIKGADNPNVVLAFDVLAGKEDVGNRVAVIGGGLVGTETADHLALHGKQVVLMDMQDAIAKDGFVFNNHYLLESIDKHHVEVITSAKVLEITPDAVIYEKGGEPLRVEQLDTIILALGAVPVDTLSQEFKDMGIDVMVVGDSAVVKQAIDAIKDGFEAGLAV
ncbi:FAD-dependent oxidoreductase [Paenibacillus sp. NPDC056722]|uniref:oxidoreductase n=1 Tax=Paenibacillus sp. NPDC056722 TaxID=3345924 RepID=UPI0036821671